jgi:hypothetical protein
MNSSQLSISSSLDEFLTPRPMTYLSFSLSFDHEEADVLLRERKVHGVHHHADVGAVLAADGLLGDVDELDRRFVEGPLVLGIDLPVGVGLLDDDLALLDETLEDLLDLEGLVLGVAESDGNVLEIDVQRDLQVIAPFRVQLLDAHGAGIVGHLGLLLSFSHFAAPPPAGQRATP